jgi:hypothetical protein
MKEIQLTRGKIAIVDNEDYDMLSQFNWCYSQVGYAVSRIDNKVRYLHRILLGENSLYVDHINRNKLDNRRSNLRVCDGTQNNANIPKPKTNTSGYKGVHWAKNAGKWVAQIWVRGEYNYLGLIEDVSDAAMEYDRAATENFGEFASVNFPPIGGN